MMRLENISSIFALVVVALYSSNLWVAEAKPGIAGAAWSKDEVNIAKAKIWELLVDPDYFVEKDNKKAEEDNVCGDFCWEGCDDFDKNPAHPFCTHCSKITTETGNCCTGWCDTQKGQNPIRPSAPKIVRLAFHDCLKYEDGTGGCDGCLGWQGMGVTYRTKDKVFNGIKDNSFPQDLKGLNGDNNNLHQTVLALEFIYTNKKMFGDGKSLEDRGKSRADFWALAGIVAIEYSVNNNNLACKEETDVYSKRLKGHSCGHRHMGEEGCMLTMPRIPFRTGRKDCVPDQENLNKGRGYIASSKKHEVHPNPFMNGKELTEFMKKNFNLQPKEVVALMGAHTLGQVDPRNSMFKYIWTRNEQAFFNNEYYHSLADDKQYVLQCKDCELLANCKECKKHSKNGKFEKISVTDINGCKFNEKTGSFIKIGTSDGSPSPVSWKPKGREWTENGGPWFWGKMHHHCFDGGVSGGGWQGLLAKYLSTGIFDSPEEVVKACWDPSKQSSETPNKWTCDKKCMVPDEFGDEIMLSVDMGLYLKFQTKKEWGGRQYGCDGFNNITAVKKTPTGETFKDGTPKYKKEKYNPWLENKEWASPPLYTGCPLNDVTSKFVEQYRDDQVLWAKDFGKVYTKMTYNAFDDDGKKLKLRKGKANFYHYCSRNPPNHGEKFSKVECK